MDRGRHTEPQAVVRVSHEDANVMDETGRQFLRLHGLGREFGDRRDEADRPSKLRSGKLSTTICAFIPSNTLPRSTVLEILGASFFINERFACSTQMI
jgi:hypothetical protein